MFTILAISTFVASLQLVHAETSLYIPGFDPQPLSVSVGGVGSDGRTTYVIAAVSPTGTEDAAGLPTPLTMVEGPNDAAYTYALDASDVVAESCTFASIGAEATCIVSASGDLVNNAGIATEIETASPIPLQGGDAAAATTTPGSTTLPTGGSSNTGGAANTGTSGNTGTAPNPTQTHSGAVALSVSFVSMVLAGPFVFLQ